MLRTVYFGLLSPAHMGSRDSGRAFLETLIEATQDWAPEKYNHFEPVNRSFDPAKLDEALDAWRFSFLWRRKQPRVSGSAWFGGKGHSAVYITVDQRSFAIESALRFLQGFSRHFPVDLSYIHVGHDSDSKDLHHYRRHVEPLIAGLTTHSLREGLPGVPWAMLFGRPYLDLFGRDHLLGTPATRVEETAGGIYVQLTPEVSDVTEKRESYLLAQRAARAHLNNDAFVDAASPNSRSPEFICPIQ